MVLPPAPVRPEPTSLAAARYLRAMAAEPQLDPLAGFRLDGKVAIVTGASSGLGARFARVLHAAGATVAVTARRRDRLEQLVAELDGALAIPCDLGRRDQLERPVAET